MFSNIGLHGAHAADRISFSISILLYIFWFLDAEKL